MLKEINVDIGTRCFWAIYIHLLPCNTAVVSQWLSLSVSLDAWCRQVTDINAAYYLPEVFDNLLLLNLLRWCTSLQHVKVVKGHQLKLHQLCCRILNRRRGCPPSLAWAWAWEVCNRPHAEYILSVRLSLRNSRETGRGELQLTLSQTFHSR